MRLFVVIVLLAATVVTAYGHAEETPVIVNWKAGLEEFLATYYPLEDPSKRQHRRKQALVRLHELVALAEEQKEGEPAVVFDRERGLLVFQMLEDIVGDEAFGNVIRQFGDMQENKSASLETLRVAFEQAYGAELGWFFEQWFKDRTIPHISAEDIRVEYRGTKAKVFFSIVQKGSAMRLFVPVVLQLDNGRVEGRFEVTEEKTSFTMETDGIPRSLVIDGNYHLCRHLDENENPPSVFRFFAAERRVLAVPDEKSEEYRKAAEAFAAVGFTVKKDSEITAEDIGGSALLVPDATVPFGRRLFGDIPTEEGEQIFEARRNPLDSRRVIAFFAGFSPGELAESLKAVSGHADAGKIVFSKGAVATTEPAKGIDGLRFAVTVPVSGTAVSRNLSLSEILDRVGDSNVIYVGELHDRLAHHRVQLEVIRTLHQRGKKIAIGMEMFQQPFQGALDDYISGRTEEKTFLKKTEYFTRWGFDYRLYREILIYAREFGIPVIALNIKKEIVSKVGKEGIQSLTEEERKELPAAIDFTDDIYRERLFDIFSAHRRQEGRGFDYFYQAQLLWDESMAHGIDAFLQENPDRTVVVLAGNGHLAYSSGIPGRLHRLNGRAYAVLLNDEQVDEGIADYVLSPEPLDLPESPKLMVMLGEEQGRVSVTAFVPGSVSEAAGVREDDIVLSIDGEKVEAIDDLKIHLLQKEKGDVVRLRVKRKRFLLGDKEYEIDVKL